ncbi:MAG: beta strand repeat-containing protein, partial [Mycobacterium sp.]
MALQVDYADNDTNFTDYTTNAPNAPLTLSILSGSASQFGVISGSLGLTKDGAGTLVLAGSNTYDGLTAIRSGVLEVSTLGSVGGGASALGSPTTAANGTIALGDGTHTGTLYFNNSGFSSTTTNRNVDLAGTTGGGVIILSDNTPGVTFTGNITSSGVGAKTLTLSDNNLGSISGSISGTDLSLAVDGTVLLGEFGGGIWKLTGNNSFGGGVTINKSDLWFSANSLGSGTTLDFYAGALVFNGTNTTDISLRTVTFHAGDSFIDVGGNNVTFTQAIGNSGAGGLIKNGTGTLTMAGANTYTGATTVREGTLVVSTLADGGVASGIGAGSAAAVNLSLQGGTLRYTGAGASTDRLFNIQFGSGTLDSSGTGAVNFTNTGTISNDGAITTLTLAGSNTGNNTLAGSIVEGGNTLSLTKTGAGTWILNGTNSYTGSTTISNGTLRLGPTGTLPSRPITISATGAGATAWLDLNDRNATATSLTLGGSTSTSSAKLTTGTGTLTLGGNVTFSATGNSLGATLSGNIALGSSTRTFNVADSSNAPIDVLVSAVVSGAGGLTKSGAGTLQLSGANTYTGQTLVSAGTVTINTLANVGGGASSLGAPTSPANGTIGIGATTTSATLAYTGSGSTTDRILNLAGTTGGATINASGTGPIAFTSSLTATGANSKTLTLTGTNTGANTIAGAIVNNSGTNKTSVSKTGAGTWVLSGTSTYTGATTVSAGTLKVNGTLNSGSAVTVAGGTLAGSGT